MGTYRSIPDPGNSLQSVITSVQALVEVVQEMTGQRASGARASQLQVSSDAQIKGLNTQIQTILARLKAANIP